MNLVGDSFQVTGLGGSIEMQAPTSSIVPGVIRFKDAEGNTRGTLNSDGTFTLTTVGGTPVFSANATSGLGANMVSSGAITNGAITADKISAGAIVADKIAANTITADKIAAGTITADRISTNSLLVGNFAGACAVFFPRNRLDDDILITTNLTWRVMNNGTIEVQYAAHDPNSASMGARYGLWFSNLRSGDAVIFSGPGYCSENCASVVSNDTTNRLLYITRPLNGAIPSINEGVYRTNNGLIWFVSLGSASRNVRSACYSNGKDAIVLNFETDITQDIGSLQIATSYGTWGSTTYNAPAIAPETILAARGSTFDSWSADVYAKTNRSILFGLNGVNPRYGMVAITRLL